MSPEIDSLHAKIAKQNRTIKWHRSEIRKIRDLIEHHRRIREGYQTDLARLKYVAANPDACNLLSCVPGICSRGTIGCDTKHAAQDSEDA